MNNNNLLLWSFRMKEDWIGRHMLGLMLLAMTLCFITMGIGLLRILGVII